MKKVNVFLAALLLMASCKPQHSAKPDWLNACHSVDLSWSLAFKTPAENWKIVLLTPIRPIQLAGSYSGDTLSVALKEIQGIIEGPSVLCLSSDQVCYQYAFQLSNSAHSKGVEKEYRSPKTVNPDSSLIQQRISFRTDAFRNLVIDSTSHAFFSERQITLPPVAGTFYGIRNEPLSCYYVQPGSCRFIPLHSQFRPGFNDYQIIAGPLEDRYGNLVANGTLVAFYHSNSRDIAQTQVATHDGYAYTTIPKALLRRGSVYAKIDNVISAPIAIK